MKTCKVCERELPPEMFEIEDNTCSNCLALFYMEEYAKCQMEQIDGE
jgi:hypothetical protein